MLLSLFLLSYVTAASDDTTVVNIYLAIPGLIVIVTFSLNLVNSASGESVETIKLNCFIASGMFVINTFEINFGQFKNLLLYSGLIDVKMAFTVRFFMQDAVCSIWTLTAKIDKILEITLEI